MQVYVWMLIAMGFGLPLAVLSAAQAQARAASSALEGIARQPEAAGKIQMAMIIALALIESLVIYALLMFFMLYASLPAKEDLMGLVKASYSAAAAAPAAAAPAQEGAAH